MTTEASPPAPTTLSSEPDPLQHSSSTETPTTSSTTLPTDLDPVAQAAKLTNENNSLKRRLAQYQQTLEQLTSHARREIESSARARDDALAVAADAAELREKMDETERALASAEDARATSEAALATRDSKIIQLQQELQNAQSLANDAYRNKQSLSELREKLAATQREIELTSIQRSEERQRAEKYQEQVVLERAKLLELQKITNDLKSTSAQRDQAVTARETAEFKVATMIKTEETNKTKMETFEKQISDLKSELVKLKDYANDRDDALKLANQRVKDVEGISSHHESRAVQFEQKAQETTTALRAELDQALTSLGEKNTELQELKRKERVEIEANEAVTERDSLRIDNNNLQEELEHSTEMLTRAAIDSLSDKSRIRKLEESISKHRDEIGQVRKDRSLKESKISQLSKELVKMEREIDHLRSAKRQLVDECNNYQRQIHDRDATIATKSRDLDHMKTDREDRAFKADNLSLELSNAKNTLAKRESDMVNLNQQYADVCEQMRNSSKELEDRHQEISNARRELSAYMDQIAELKQDRESYKTTMSELQVTRRQFQELSALQAEKDEELSTLKRLHTTSKSEVAELVREKKRLSDMLSDVSGDLKRANQELDLLRSVRKDQEALSSRLAQISETSTRELNLLKESQTAQAEDLARKTVDQYQLRMEKMQTAAKEDIASTVTDQLRTDIMPHLMRAVDMKAKNLIHSLAKHVESFNIADTDTSFSSSKQDYPPSRPSEKHVDIGNAESLRPPNTNLATAYASGSASESQSAPPSGYPSGPRSGVQSSARDFFPSTTESPPASVPEAFRGDSIAEEEDTQDDNDDDAGTAAAQVGNETSERSATYTSDRGFTYSQSGAFRMTSSIDSRDRELTEEAEDIHSDEGATRGSTFDTSVAGVTAEPTTEPITTTVDPEDDGEDEDDDDDHVDRNINLGSGADSSTATREAPIDTFQLYESPQDDNDDDGDDDIVEELDITAQDDMDDEYDDDDDDDIDYDEGMLADAVYGAAIVEELPDDAEVGEGIPMELSSSDPIETQVGGIEELPDTDEAAPADEDDDDLDKELDPDYKSEEEEIDEQVGLTTDKAAEIAEIDVDSEPEQSVEAEPEQLSDTNAKADQEPEQEPEVVTETRELPEIEEEPVESPDVEQEPEQLPEIEPEPEQLPEIEPEPEQLPEAEPEMEAVVEAQPEPDHFAGTMAVPIVEMEDERAGGTFIYNDAAEAEPVAERISEDEDDDISEEMNEAAVEPVAEAISAEEDEDEEAGLVTETGAKSEQDASVESVPSPPPSPAPIHVAMPAPRSGGGFAGPAESFATAASIPDTSGEAEASLAAAEQAVEGRTDMEIDNEEGTEEDDDTDVEEEDDEGAIATGEYEPVMEDVTGSTTQAVRLPTSESVPMDTETDETKAVGLAPDDDLSVPPDTTPTQTGTEKTTEAVETEKLEH